MRHDPHDDRQHDETHDVVRDGGPDDGTRLARRQRPKVAEDSCSDPDAGRRDRSADEDGCLRGGADGEHGAEPGNKRGGHPDRRHRHRRPTHRTQLGEVHLHPDLEKKQDHPDLAERSQGLVGGTDETEHRRTDDDAREDLANHRRHGEALRDFCGELRRDEHDEDVEEYGADVHEVIASTTRTTGTTSLSCPSSPRRG